MAFDKIHHLFCRVRSIRLSLLDKVSTVLNEINIFDSQETEVQIEKVKLAFRTAFTYSMTPSIANTISEGLLISLRSFDEMLAHPKLLRQETRSVIITEITKSFSWVELNDPKKLPNEFYRMGQRLVGLAQLYQKRHKNLNADKSIPSLLGIPLDISRVGIVAQYLAISEIWRELDLIVYFDPELIHAATVFTTEYIHKNFRMSWEKNYLNGIALWSRLAIHPWLSFAVSSINANHALNKDISVNLGLGRLQLWDGILNIHAHKVIIKLRSQEMVDIVFAFPKSANALRDIRAALLRLNESEQASFMIEVQEKYVKVRSFLLIYIGLMTKF